MHFSLAETIVIVGWLLAMFSMWRGTRVIKTDYKAGHRWIALYFVGLATCIVAMILGLLKVIS